MQNKTDMVIIDGSQGEGGGQILRSSLSLSMMTGKDFLIKNIRSGRVKPGLMRQHLTCVQAAAKICNADTEGATLSSQKLLFRPKQIQAGDYHFAISTSGSTSLVAQTIIPALMTAPQPSKILLEGGTHNMQAPTFDFLQYSFLPVLRQMGVDITATIHKYGFYPAGGGKVEFVIQPSQSSQALQPIKLMQRGNEKRLSAEAFFANLASTIPQRELNVIANTMGWADDNLHLRQIKKSHSSGNVVLLKLEYENIIETIISFGQLGLKAEKVAKQACDQAKEYLASEAVVGVHLADQLLLPMVIAGGGQFTTLTPTQHTQTNINVIKQFMDCVIDLQQLNDNLWQITIT